MNSTGKVVVADSSASSKTNGIIPLFSHHYNPDILVCGRFFDGRMLEKLTINPKWRGFGYSKNKGIPASFLYRS
jgi:hypothetical protein